MTGTNMEDLPIKEQMENLERKISRREINSKEYLLITTSSKSIIMGKNIKLNEEEKFVRLRDIITLESYPQKPRKIDMNIGYDYTNICSIPNWAYNETKHKLEKAGWPKQNNNNHTKIFINSLTQTLKIMGIRFTREDIEQMYKEKDKKFKTTLKELKEEEPLIYCKLKNQIESDIIEKIGEYELANRKEKEELKETLEFLTDMDIDTGTLKKALLYKKAQEYTKRFFEQDQELPIELEKLREDCPELHLSAIKRIEQETEQIIKNTEVKNLKKADECIKIISYARRCGVEPTQARETLIKKLDKIEQKKKEELRKIRQTKNLVKEE